MKRICKLILTAVMATMFAMTPFSLSAQNESDFDRALTVLDQSRARLDKALASGNDSLALKAVLDFTLAGTNIDEKKPILESIALIDSVKAQAISPQLKAMLNIIEARIYAGIYWNGIWFYLNRKPGATYTADLTTWDSRHFVDAIIGLIDEACLTEALRHTPITYFGSAIDIESEWVLYYPTLYDFVAQKSIRILGDQIFSSSCLPDIYLAPTDEFLRLPFMTFSPADNKALELFASLIEFHKNNMPALINADLQRIRYVGQRQFEKNNVAVTEALKNLYNHYSGSEYSGEILMADEFDDLAWHEPVNIWLHDALVKNLTAFPGYWQNGELADRLEWILSKYIFVYCNAFVAPGVPTQISADMTNTPEAEILIYDISKWNPLTDGDYKKFATDSAIIARLPVRSRANLLRQKQYISYTFPRAGYYLLRPVIGETKGDFSRPVCATGLGIVTVQYGDEGRLYVIDPRDSSPVAGSTVMAKSDSADITVLGKTDRNGLLKLPRLNSGMKMLLLAEKDGDRFDEPLDFKWEDVRYYHIDSSEKKKKSEQTAKKQADFRIDLSPVSTDAPAVGDVTFRGKVEALSQAVPSECNVSLTLSVTRLNRLHYVTPKDGLVFYTTETAVGPDGSFEIVVPADVFTYSPSREGCITAKFLATSDSGKNSGEVLTAFAFGRKYNLQVARLAPYTDIYNGTPVSHNAASPLAINFKVTDFQGKTVDEPVRYSFLKDSVAVSSGLLPHDGRIDVSAIPSGKYTHRLCLTDSLLANEYSQDVVLYRMDDKKSPMPVYYIWEPFVGGEIRVGSDRIMSFPFEANCESKVLTIITSGKKRSAANGYRSIRA